MGAWEAPEGWSGTKSEDGMEQPCQAHLCCGDEEERLVMMLIKRCQYSDLIPHNFIVHVIVTLRSLDETYS